MDGLGLFAVLVVASKPYVDASALRLATGKTTLIVEVVTPRVLVLAPETSTAPDAEIAVVTGSESAAMVKAAIRRAAE